MVTTPAPSAPPRFVSADIPLFEVAVTAHGHRPRPFSPHTDAADRVAPPLRRLLGRRVVKPLHCSDYSKNVDISEAIDGLRRLGSEPSPQQETLFRVIESGAAKPFRVGDEEIPVPRYSRVAVTMPRRAGKTSGLFGVVIGRCSNRVDYQVAFAAQTGAKGRKRFLEIAKQLERWDPQPPREYLAAHPEERRYTIYRSNGGERIEWANGSTLEVLPPDPENFRGDGYDLVILDEVQELEVEKSNELMGGISPTQDTRIGSQIITAGTAGKVRAGLLWDCLEDGRRRGRWAIVEYAAPDDTIDPTDEAVWARCHPGIGTLTTIDKIRDNLADLGPVDFQREYLGIWPADATTSAFDLDQWQAGAVLPLPRPTRVGLAYDVAPDGSAGALAAAWRDADGRAVIELIDYRAGVGWLPQLAHRLAIERRIPVTFDGIGANFNVSEALARKSPRVKLHQLGPRDVNGALQRVLDELRDGQLLHFNQADLNRAIQGSRWRDTEHGRMLARKGSTHDVCPIVAAIHALWDYDRQSPRASRRVIVAARAVA